MSKLLPSITGVACFFWVSGWTWIFSVGKQAATPSPDQTPINILIDSLQYQVQQPFSFEFSEATPIIPADLHPALGTISKKLNETPDLTLNISGIYSPQEKNRTSAANLGEARALAIKAILVADGAAADRISISGLVADNLFEVNKKLTGIIYFSFTNQTQGIDNQGVKKLELPAKNSKAAQLSKSFYYKIGDYKLAQSHLPFMKDLTSKLKQNLNATVELTGYSEAEEEAASSKVNLAEMRALAVRRYLVDHGVRRSQITVKAKPSMARTQEEMIVNIQVFE